MRGPAPPCGSTWHPLFSARGLQLELRDRKSFILITSYTSFCFIKVQRDRFLPNICVEAYLPEEVASSLSEHKALSRDLQVIHMLLSREDAEGAFWKRHSSLLLLCLRTPDSGHRYESHLFPVPEKGKI